MHATDSSRSVWAHGHCVRGTTSAGAQAMAGPLPLPSSRTRLMSRIVCNLACCYVHVVLRRMAAVPCAEHAVAAAEWTRQTWRPPHPSIHLPRRALESFYIVVSRSLAPALVGDGILPYPAASHHGGLCSGLVAPSYARHAKSPGLIPYVRELAAVTVWSPALTRSTLLSSPVCPPTWCWL